MVDDLTYYYKIETEVSYMCFAEKLQKLRKAKGMSQENLADEIGVSRQAVSKWELGVSLPDMDKIIVLSDLFGVSVDYLVKDNVTETGGCGGSAAAVEQDACVHTVRRGWYPMFMLDYEYKSKRTLFGLPLVHVNLGYGLKKAKGIIAVGTVAKGFIAFGCFSFGLISIGALSAGLIGLGALTFGLLLAGGAVAVGAMAFGGLAVGIVAMGGAALGVFSFGGYASGSQIAVGGYARGNIAIGRIVKGAYTIKTAAEDVTSIPASQVRALIDKVYPQLWQPVRELFTSFFS
jgi:transcriptional regulator with XRE-family HTH domain